jgi:hypothetical protein
MSEKLSSCLSETHKLTYVLVNRIIFQPLTNLRKAAINKDLCFIENTQKLYELNSSNGGE